MRTQRTFLFVTALFGALLVLASSGVQKHSWKTYTNARFQYSICYPADLLIPQGEPENADGQTFLAKDGGKLLVFGRNNALNQTMKEVMEETAARLKGGTGKVTYQVMKPDWFVLSGENGQIFYAKMLSVSDQLKSFEITYDSSAAELYKPVVGRIASCFASTGR